MDKIEIRKEYFMMADFIPEEDRNEFFGLLIRCAFTGMPLKDPRVPERFRNLLLLPLLEIFGDKYDNH